MGKLQIMSAREGHETLVWVDPETEPKEEEITQEEANRRFYELTSRGFLGFTAQAGETGTMTRQFDPTAEELIMVPPMVGG